MNKYRVIMCIYVDQEGVDAQDAANRVEMNMNLPVAPYSDHRVIPAVQGCKGSPLLESTIVRAVALASYPNE